MIQEFGEFAVRYSEDLSNVIIAYTTIVSALAMHVVLHERLGGILKPTGKYSHLNFKDHIFLGMHFENTVTEEQLKEALTR